MNYILIVHCPLSIFYSYYLPPRPLLREELERLEERLPPLLRPLLLREGEDER